jgi:very-short-patch-repair endonuclease
LGVRGRTFAMRKDLQLKENARALRRNQSPAEKKLWRALRDRRFADFKFRRQQVLGSYIVDFFCARAALALELDWETHFGRETPDANRQSWLEGQGIKVLRFWNTQVFDEFEAVLEAIWLECDRLSKVPPPHPQPLSPGGERGDDKTETSI